MSTNNQNNLFGQSLIEIILAVGIFVIVSSSSVIAVLGSFSTGRLAEEESKAVLLANQGIEGANSIKNTNWANLTNGDHGISSVSGWSFNGTSDTDPTGKYLRKVTISDVYRDGSSNIVLTGGTIDSDTKKIVASVTWNFTASRQDSVVYESYLTNWQKSKANGSVTGISSCSGLCQSLAYTGGTCRQTPSACVTNGEVNQSIGDQYCLVAPNSICCCLP